MPRIISHSVLPFRDQNPPEPGPGRDGQETVVMILCTEVYSTVQHSIVQYGWCRERAGDGSIGTNISGPNCFQTLPGINEFWSNIYLENIENPFGPNHKTNDSLTNIKFCFALCSSFPITHNTQRPKNSIFITLNSSKKSGKNFKTNICRGLLISSHREFCDNQKRNFDFHYKGLSIMSLEAKINRRSDYKIWQRIIMVNWIELPT